MKSIAIIFGLLSVASAAAPAGGLPLVPANPTAFAFVSDGPQQALAEVVPVVGQPFSRKRFWEGRHWKPDAALWRRDWSIKPNGKVWTDLTMREWHSAGQAVTDADGWISFRGFHGSYTLEIEQGGMLRMAEVALDKSRPSAVVHSHPTPN